MPSMTKDTLEGLTHITIYSSKTHPEDPARQQMRSAVQSSVDLMTRHFTPEQVLSFRYAWGALDDKLGEYAWSTVLSEEGNALAFVAYTPVKTLPGTSSKTIPPATYGNVWLLGAEEEHKPYADILLKQAINAHEQAKQTLETKADIGLIADTATNCTDVYVRNGFAELPFSFFVPSLEEGKEREIVGETSLLIRPGEQYKQGLPAHYVKKLIGTYLWAGYESPKTGAPFQETVKSMERALVPGERGLIVPLRI